MQPITLQNLPAVAGAPAEVNTPQQGQLGELQVTTPITNNFPVGRAPVQQNPPTPLPDANAVTATLQAWRNWSNAQNQNVQNQ